MNKQLETLILYNKKKYDIHPLYDESLKYETFVKERHLNYFFAVIA